MSEGRRETSKFCTLYQFGRAIAISLSHKGGPRELRLWLDNFGTFGRIGTGHFSCIGVRLSILLSPCVTTPFAKLWVNLFNSVVTNLGPLSSNPSQRTRNRCDLLLTRRRHTRGFNEIHLGLLCPTRCTRGVSLRLGFSCSTHVIWSFLVADCLGGTDSSAHAQLLLRWTCQERRTAASGGDHF